MSAGIQDSNLQLAGPEATHLSTLSSSRRCSRTEKSTILSVITDETFLEMASWTLFKQVDQYWKDLCLNRRGFERLLRLAQSSFNWRKELCVHDLDFMPSCVGQVVCTGECEEKM